MAQLNENQPRNDVQQPALDLQGVKDIVVDRLKEHIASNVELALNRPVDDFGLGSADFISASVGILDDIEEEYGIKMTGEAFQTHVVDELPRNYTVTQFIDKIHEVVPRFKK